MRNNAPIPVMSVSRSASCHESIQFGLAARLSALTLLFLLASASSTARASEVDLETSAKSRPTVSGSGRVIEETRPVLDVSGVRLLSEGHVVITQGSPETLVIRAEDNLLPHITTEMAAGVLEIGSDVELEPTKPIEYFLTVEGLDRAELVGAGEITASGLSAAALALRLSGAGALRFDDLDATRLDVDLQGAGDVYTSGTVDQQTVSIGGVGTYYGHGLESTTAEVRIPGVGEATVRVERLLRVVITGTGTVRYLGDPQVDSTVTGRGEVVHLADTAAPDWRPQDLGDGWPLSTPEDQGIDSRVIETMMETAATDPRLDTIYSLLVVRHGTLVAEGYFNHRRPEQMSEIRSATKSFTSLLVGIAMDQGLVASVDQPLLELLPTYADLLSEPQKRGLTLEDALTMRLGLRWDENVYPYRWDDWPRDLVRYTLEQPVAESAGTRFRYSSGTSQVLAAVVTEATGKELHAFAEETLFAPLGIQGTHWMRHDDGSHYGGVGLIIRPRDMAKIGQLMLQNGRWETSRGTITPVVSKDWVQASTEAQVKQTSSLLEGYGYQWWVQPDDDDFAAIGHGGQWIAVLPQSDGLLVFTADPNVGANDSIDITPLLEIGNELEIEHVPGHVGFPRARNAVAAGAGRVVLPVRRSGGSDGAAKVVFETAGGSARPGEDFESTSGVLSWKSGESSPRWVEIPILDDGRRDGEETFEVRLSILTGGITLDRAVTTIAVDGNGQPPSGSANRLQWEQTTYSVREGDVLTARVHRAGADDRAVSVRWSTADRSARSGTDYEGAGGLLTWPAGDSSPRSIDVHLLADGIEERTEIMDLRLYEPIGGATLDGGSETKAVVAILDDDGDQSCTPDAETLCLNQGRFRVEVEWQDPHTAARGFGRTLPGTEDTGMLWFFDADNAELVVKVLDGRPLNDAFWLYYGGLSDVEYWLVVTDTIDGAVRVYHNPSGNVCGDADIQAFPQARGSSASTMPAAESIAPIAPITKVAAGCGSSNEALCLLDGRFQIEVRWHDQRSGDRGIGRVVDGGPMTGTFWFFDPANVELVVKALDGRSVNGKHWFFYGALSDVEYWITVTDTASGVERQYHNEPGNLCGGADVEAFD